MSVSRRVLLRGLAGALPVAVAGCSLPARLASIPEGLRGHRSFNGFPSNIRAVLDGTDDATMASIAIGAFEREVAWANREGRRDLGPATYLAISGGGADGAFGAGLLVEWTALGTRPEFKCVTGVSTGALAAPFAFLGPAYDRQLKEVYTDVSEADIMVSRGALTALFGDSLYDSSPLRRLVRKFLTPELVAAIGCEYGEKGRLLLVATTDLDVPVGVLWNLGAIAASGRSDATDLMVDILVASASIPGIFPPVMINLEVDGKPYQEMHVDGGTVAQVVLYPPSLRVDIANPELERRLANRRRSLYIIRNSRLGTSTQTIDRSTFKIAERALATLIANQGIGDLYELYMLCQRDRIDYNVAIIPERFTAKPDGKFDRAYMNALFDLARAEMAAGRAWRHYPPGFNPTPLVGTTRSTVQN